MNEPFVSVIVLTYNHEKFIVNCLDSLLSQDYPNLEIIVCDDASTDRTPEIISSFAQKSIKVNVFLSDTNQGPAKNFIRALAKCKGEFIAICEGDDLWVSPEKISLQISYIVGSGASIAYADYCKIDEGGKIITAKVLEPQPDSFDLVDLIDEHGPSTNSILFRKNAIPEKLPADFFTVLNPDVFIIGYGLASGKSVFIDKVLSAHREHESGIWTSKDKFERGLIRYSTLVKFYRSIREVGAQKIALSLLEKQILLARKKNTALFQKYFPELSLRRRLLLRLKWAYARIKNVSR